MDSNFFKTFSSLTDYDQWVIDYIHKSHGVTRVDIMGAVDINLRKLENTIVKLNQYSMLVHMPDGTYHLSRHGRQFWDRVIKELNWPF